MGRQATLSPTPSQTVSIITRHQRRHHRRRCWSHDTTMTYWCRRQRLCRWTMMLSLVLACGRPATTSPSTPTPAPSSTRCRRGRPTPALAYHRPCRLRRPELLLGFLPIKHSRRQSLNGQLFRLTAAWCHRRTIRRTRRRRRR